MDEKEAADITALPVEGRPDIHQARERFGPISLEQEKQIRDGCLPANRFDDDRMRDLPVEDPPPEPSGTDGNCVPERMDGSNHKA